MHRLTVDIEDQDYLKLESLSRTHGKQIEEIISRFVAEGLSQGKSGGNVGKSAHEIAYAQARREAVPRISELGLLGEKLAFELLEQHPAFHSVQPLNELERNHPYADLFAVRDSEKQAGERLVISVKTRNKYSNQRDKNGTYRLNGKYNILPKAQKLALEVARKYDATPAWIAVQVDARRNAYSCYFGYLSDCLGNGIHMLEKHTKDYVSLAQDAPAPFDLRHLHNLD
jgi:hypothetical protein